MIEAVELQVICRILTTDSKEEVDTLSKFGTEYYSAYKEQAEYVLNHIDEYGEPPDVFTFQAQFPDISLVKVSEPIEYLVNELNKNRQHIILIETFNKLKSLASGDVGDAWKYLASQCDKVAELDSSDPMDIIHDAKKRSDQVVEFSKQSRIPTGFTEIDKLMYGGLSTVEELLLIVARTNTGKAQPLWSKVLTPSGWVTMSDLKIGDEVVGKNNDNGKVIQIFPQGEKDYYKVYFDDNTFVECCADHLWEVRSIDLRKNHDSDVLKIPHSVVSLRSIIDNFNTHQYFVDITEPIEFNSSNILDYDEDIHSYFEDSVYDRKLVIQRFLGLKSIDSAFDGSMHSGVSFSTEMAEYFSEVARSIGLKVWVSPYESYEGDHWKIDCWYFHTKRIIGIKYEGKTKCQCILLDNSSHTYITDGYNVTHNSWVCTKMMESGQKNGFPVLYYSPEMQASYLGTRFDTWRAHFQNSQLHQGKYTPDYIEYIEKLEHEETSAFVLEDKDVAGGTVDIRVIEHIVKLHKIKLLIVDGLSYMEDIRRSDTDYVKYKNICLDLFRISKKYGCAVVIAMQANRETKENKDEKGLPFPSLENVEGSDHPGRIATQAFALRQIFDKHVMEIRLEKSRIANNQKPVLSYAWDVNTGNMQYLPGGEEDPVANLPAQTTVTPKIVNHQSPDSDSEDFSEEDFDDQVEF